MRGQPKLDPLLMYWHRGDDAVIVYHYTECGTLRIWFTTDLLDTGGHEQPSDYVSMDAARRAYAGDPIYVLIHDDGAP